jgi:hypothetical protein
MDGHFLHSLAQATKTLTNDLSLIRRHHAPGAVCIHLLNTVTIPKLCFQLQFTPVPPAELAKLDTQIRPEPQHP